MTNPNIVNETSRKVTVSPWTTLDVTVTEWADGYFSVYAEAPPSSPWYPVPEYYDPLIDDATTAPTDSDICAAYEAAQEHAFDMSLNRY